MKKQLTLLLFAFISFATFAQTGGFNYKALIVDNGTALNTQPITIKFTVLESGSTSVYQETQNATTNANGIVSVNIGEGTVISGTFSTIDWGSNSNFLKVEIDTGSGYQDFGTSEFKTVPYAKYADKAGNAFSGNFSDLNGVPTGLADGDDVNDADHNASNELQTLAFDNTSRQLSITNGNTVTIPAGSSTGGDGWGAQVAATNSSINGDGTSGSPLGINTSDAIFNGWDKNASDDFDGDFSHLTNVPAGLANGDDDTQLTDAQITAMGYIKNANDADHSTTNEIQNLSLSTNQLTISGSNTVTFTGWDTDASDDFSGNYEDLSNTPFRLIGSPSTPPSGLSDNLFHLGTVFIGTGYGNTSKKLSVENNTSENTWNKAITVDVLGGGTGDRTGIVTNVSGTSTGNINGLSTSITNSQDGTQTGMTNSLSNDGNGNHIGTNNSISGTGTGQHYGTKNLMYAHGTGNNIGVYSELNNSGNGSQFGTKNNITNDGTGLHIGTYNLINNNGSGKHYGTKNQLNGSAAGTKYGTYNVINSTAGGLHYAVYADAQKTGSYAGYFLGKVAIKDGTEGADKVFTSDANGKGAWQDVSAWDTDASDDVQSLGDLSDAKREYKSFYIGLGAGQNSTGMASYNVGLGYGALNSNNVGDYITAVGSSSLRDNTGDRNTAIGASALYYNKANSGSVAVGYNAMYYADKRTTGRETYNTAIGYESLKGSTTPINNTGQYNTALGYQSLTVNSSGYGNTAVGSEALSSNTTGVSNTANGINSLKTNSTGTGNTAMGSFSLFANTSGVSNVANGNSSLRHNTIGYDNVAVGSSSLNSNTEGYGNTAMGSSSLNSNTTGNNNTSIGYKAGYNNSVGSKNVFLGNKAGYNETGSDKLYIDNSNTSNPLIYGNFSSNELTVNANLLTVDNVGGQARLIINAAGTNNPSTHYYLDDAYKTSSGYNVNQDAFFIYHNHNVFFKNGNVLPTGHRQYNLGAHNNAWNNVYAHNYITEGSAAYTDRKVTNEIIAHPPVAKKDGDFDAKSDGLYELNPKSLPKNLHTENGLKIDEIATYNYKANYEQQLQINEQQKQIEALKKQLEEQKKLIQQILNNK